MKHRTSNPAMNTHELINEINRSYGICVNFNNQTFTGSKRDSFSPKYSLQHGALKKTPCTIE